MCFLAAFDQAADRFSALIEAALGSPDDDVLTRLDRLAEDDCVAFGRGVFDHHDGVCTFRHGGAGHDLYAGSGRDGNFGSVASFEFTDAAESCAGRDFSGANGETVSDGAVERRVKAIGADFLRERAAEGVVYRGRFFWARRRRDES